MLINIHKTQVSKASKGFEESTIEESKKLLQELSNMQNVLSSEVMDLNEYAENVKDHYVDDTFSSAECVTAMENSLLEWLYSFLYFNFYV